MCVDPELRNFAQNWSSLDLELVRSQRGWYLFVTSQGEKRSFLPHLAFWGSGYQIFLFLFGLIFYQSIIKRARVSTYRGACGRNTSLKFLFLLRLTLLLLSSSSPWGQSGKTRDRYNFTWLYEFCLLNAEPTMEYKVYMIYQNPLIPHGLPFIQHRSYPLFQECGFQVDCPSYYTTLHGTGLGQLMFLSGIF